MAMVDTRERILDAAESLFARQGFSATSLRAVIAEAGVNLAAVHYHFGSREELVREVFARRFDPINRQRLALLDQLEPMGGRAAGVRDAAAGRKAAAPRDDAAGRRPPAPSQPSPGRLERVLEILVVPLLHAASDMPEAWSTVSLLVGRAHTDADFVVRQILHDQFREVFQRVSLELAACLPHLGEDELAYRLHFTIAAMAVTLVHKDDVRILSDGRVDPTSDAEAFARRWVAFAAGGLGAPAVQPADSASPRPAAIAGASGSPDAGGKAGTTGKSQASGNSRTTRNSDAGGTTGKSRGAGKSRITSKSQAGGEPVATGKASATTGRRSRRGRA